MHKVTLAALVAVAVAANPVVAQAAPKNYCAELKGTQSGTTCTVSASDPLYTVTISFPTDYYDEKSIADYVNKTRDSFVNAAKGAPGDQPHTLNITSAGYQSLVPPRGSKAVVLTTYENLGAAHPRISYQAFNWDQTYRKAITYDTLWQKDADPLPVVVPYVQSELSKKAGQPVTLAPEVAFDPANYQQFAVTGDGVIFFFGQGTLLPEAAGAVQVLVPRSVIDPLLA
jgi:hypothetical protein